MDLLTFISNLVSALAWPAVVVGILIYLRKEFPGLLASLRKLKFSELEVEFGQAAAKVAGETAAVVPPPTPDKQLLGQPEADIEDQLNAIAELSPRAAILEAWLRVEAAAISLIRKHRSTPLTSMPGPLRLKEGLMKAEVLTPPQIAAYESLRKLRNEAVHAPEAEFTPSSVANYVRAALSMAAYLEDMSRM